MKTFTLFFGLVIVLPLLYSPTEGKIFCFRRLKKRDKCGGHLKRVEYATPQECCAGKGVGFAAKKLKVGRNRFTCTPCSELQTEQGDKSGAKVKPPKPQKKNAFDITTESNITTVITTFTPDAEVKIEKVTEDQQANHYFSFPRSTDEQTVKVEWSEWSPCSASCGAGWRSRFKICDSCDKNDYENVISQPCMVNFYCPVDGNWGPWFPWQPCTLSCGGGTRMRQRKCNYPPPAYGGASCSGLAKMSQDCNEQPCPVDGNWGEWSEFTTCSATCGQGSKRRTRTCDNPAPSNGGRECAGSDNLTKKCENEKCPQDGEWSLWSDWSNCGVTCGEGVRTRSRDCDSPQALYGGKECEGEAVQTLTCVSNRPCPVDGGWSEWNEYGFCRAPRCESGFRIRTRQCSNPKPQHGGAHCKGNQYERVECFNDQDCPRNGSWCEWSEWSACSASCAGQTALQVRQRTCTCPEPRFGGKDCDGDSLTVRDCAKLSLCNTTLPTTVDSDRKCKGGLEGSGSDADCDEVRTGRNMVDIKKKKTQTVRREVNRVRKAINNSKTISL